LIVSLTVARREKMPGAIAFSAFSSSAARSARLDVDARNPQFHARLAIPVLVAVMVAIDPLVHHLVADMLVDTTVPADIFAADLAANAGDGFGEADIFGRAAQAGRANRGPGIRLT
jgi:hypothetical protein